MTIKELKKYFTVYKWEDCYLIHSLEEGGSRMNHKYLGKVYKKGGSFFVEGFKPTTKIDTLKAQLRLWQESLNYHSDYYYPLYREEAVIEFLLIDKLKEYGFDRKGYSDGFKLNRGSIYGYNATNIDITYIIKDDSVTINLWTSRYTWVSVNSDHTLENIENKLDGLLKPLFLTEGVENIKTADKMQNSKIDVLLKELRGVDINSQKFNSGLKSKLLSLAETL